MNRRALIVGSALAGVGAVLGVKATAVTQPVQSADEIQIERIKQTDWYQAMVARRTLENLGMSGYGIQQILDPPLFPEPQDEIITADYSRYSSLWNGVSFNKVARNLYGRDDGEAGALHPNDLAEIYRAIYLADPIDPDALPAFRVQGRTQLQYWTNDGWRDGPILIIDPSPEWLEMNASMPSPQPYRLSGPDSRRAGI